MKAKFVAALAAAWWLGSAAGAFAQYDQTPTLLPLPEIHSPPGNYPYPMGGESAVIPASYPSSRRGQQDQPVPLAQPNLVAPQPLSTSPGPGMNPWIGFGTEQDAWDGNCSGCSTCTTCCSPWFGGVYGLFMQRDRDNDYRLSYEVGPQTTLLTSQSADIGWQGGAEARVGRWFGCRQWGLEAVYWGMFENSADANIYASQTGTGTLGTALTLNNLEGAGTNIAQFFDGAQRHRLQRDFQANNLELNLLHVPLLGYPDGCCDGHGSRFRWMGLLGVRYLRIDDGFHYDESFATTDFSDPIDDWYYNIDTANNLLGAQLGLRGDWFVTRRVSLFADTKFGLFGNHMTLKSNVVNGLGDAAVINNGQFNGQFYDFKSSKDDVSFVGELRLGLGYQLTPNWRLMAAYRAIAVTGVALSTNQIPVNFNNLQRAEAIDSNGSLILHGGQFGIEYNY